MNTVCLKDRQLLLNGKPFQILSGAMHYFRIHPDLWQDRLEKAVAMGLNTIETYTCWNCHELKPGQFDFTGILDIERYLTLIHEQGLYAVVRPGPYICAEWEGGGLPGWLATYPGLELRCTNAPFMNAVKRYYDELLPRLKKHLFSAGGPIIAIQIENEYGSFGCDKNYLKFVYDLYRQHGLDCICFTADGGAPHYLQGGTLDGCPAAVNFGSHPEANFAAARAVRPDEPDACMEFWNGWFDHWGEKHHVRSSGLEDGGAGADLETMLKRKAHVNLYMFHGGTNFGFTNGANGSFYTDYAPTVTSYDYDCPLSEAGDPTPKFWAFQEIISRHLPNPRMNKDVKASRKFAPQGVKLTASRTMLNAIDELAETSGNAVVPPTMDQLGQTFGFIHYRRRLAGPLPRMSLRLIQVNDYAQVYLDGKLLGSRFREDGRNPLSIQVPPEGAVMDVIVENCGRINYGPYVGKDPKGITIGVCLELQRLTDWSYDTLPLSTPPTEGYGELLRGAIGAAFHKGTFTLEDTADTFLKRPGKKGLVWINGFNLGRYWERGPQETLYVPAPVLRKGDNTIVVLELEELNSDAVEFSAEPILG